jgi:hypothetical protein
MRQEVPLPLLPPKGKQIVILTKCFAPHPAVDGLANTGLGRKAAVKFGGPQGAR